MRLVSLVSLVLAALLGLSSPALATTVVRQGLDSLTDASDIVIRGVVERVDGHAELQGQPFRLARVRVAETLAGSAPSVVAVRLPGGAALDGTPRVAVGVPEWIAGDEVVLFLTRVPPGIVQRPSRPAGGEHVQARGRVAAATGPPAAEQWMPIALALGAYRVERANGVVTAAHDPQARGLAVAGALPTDGDAPESIELTALTKRVTSRRTQQGKP